MPAMSFQVANHENASSGSVLGRTGQVGKKVVDIRHIWTRANNYILN
jgi:hypothetical protein